MLEVILREKNLLTRTCSCCGKELSIVMTGQKFCPACSLEHKRLQQKYGWIIRPLREEIKVLKAQVNELKVKMQEKLENGSGNM